MADLQEWRKRNKLTQVEAAASLGVSQTYLSLLEKGARPMTDPIRNRLKSLRGSGADPTGGTNFAAQLASLGYAGFAHLAASRPKADPEAFLLNVLSRTDADARVVDALPWVVRRYSGQMDLPWLTRQAKLLNFQNRLGFLLAATGLETVLVSAAIGELDRARLLEEATLCWDSMPNATRDWIRKTRAPLAGHWNILTTMQPSQADDAA